MPIVNIPRLGEVEFTRIPLAHGIKGITKIGKLDFPILINEALEPGTKTDWVVAHEAGHRLMIEMIFEAIKHNPDTFKKAPGLASGLAQHFINSGLQQSKLTIKHPEVNARLSTIFSENKSGKYTDEDLAREFVSEIFAGWATGEVDVGPHLSSIFESLISAKHAGELPPLTSGEQKKPVAAMPPWFDPWAAHKKGSTGT